MPPPDIELVFVTSQPSPFPRRRLLTSLSRFRERGRGGGCPLSYHKSPRLTTSAPVERPFQAVHTLHSMGWKAHPTQSHLTTSAPRRTAFPGCSHAPFDGLESLVGAKRRFAPTTHYPTTHRSGRRPCRPQPLAHELKSDGHVGPPTHCSGRQPCRLGSLLSSVFPFESGADGPMPHTGGNKERGILGGHPHAPRPATQAPRPFAKRPGMG